MYSRRFVLRAASLATVLPLSTTLPALAADALKIGVLIPGSKSDKGWMESGYDGMMAAEKKYGSKINVNYIENVQFADMPQALVQLASANVMVIGVGGQTQASVFKVAPRFPKVKFAVVGGNDDPARPANVSIYDVRQAEIAFVAGAAARDAVENRRRQLYRRPADSGHRQCRQGIRSAAPNTSIRTSNTSKPTPATSTTCKRPRKPNWPPSPRARTSATTS